MARIPINDLAEAFYDPLGSWDQGAFGGPIGGHSDHVHLSVTDANAMLNAIRYAQSIGLHVGENPYVGAVDPNVHVAGSYHYRDFPGLYGGKQLGEGIDVSGAADQMANYYRWATGGGGGSSRSLASASTPTFSSSPLVSMIVQTARRYGVDPQAALAVASTEGLSGGIGDNNTSFGPFQLHYGGAYPSYAPQGASASQSWATSKPGIEYAIRSISKVAGGLQGKAAVSAIVRRFERPADPNSEVTKAWSRYGNVSATSAPGASGTTGKTPAAPVSPFASVPYEKSGSSPFQDIFKQLMSGGPTKGWVDPAFKAFG